MSTFLQSIRRKVTTNGQRSSSTFIFNTFVITSVTTLVSAFSFFKAREHPRTSSVKLLQYTRLSLSSPNTLSQRIVPPNSISSHCCSKPNRLAAMVSPNTTLCDNGESNIQPSSSVSIGTVVKNEEHTGGEHKTTEHYAGQEDSSTYYYKRMKDPPRNLVDGHAIFGALLKPGYIERYDTYRRVPLMLDKENAKESTTSSNGNKEVCVADVKVGESLNGHAGIVHGGIISLILDDTLGWGYEALHLSSREENPQGENDYSLVVTANLTVNYRKPLRAGSNFVVRVFHEKTEGRKIYFTARIESYDGQTLYAEASSLFIKVKNEHISTSMSAKKSKD